MMASSVMKLSYWVNLKVKHITSHFYYIWASEFSGFPD